ncbi:3-isopropylmalate dehydratase small subunit [Frankliniella fusca]|uniref:3-isopropylmalate dehydratase small subunit n=1 Tax=Frankliniella fusca TaxID=407009 RepID=A0AAE1HRW7_9NEOP|nr:3-isopropylmalate dehydratase small subunit [Frankliniella fusca]
MCSAVQAESDPTSDPLLSKLVTTPHGDGEASDTRQQHQDSATKKAQVCTGKMDKWKTAWIRDLDHESDWKDESFIIEWQVGPKPSCGEWDIYDGILLALHDDLGYLEGLKNQEADRTSNSNNKENNHSRGKSKSPKSVKTSTVKSSADDTVDLTPKNIQSILAQLLANGSVPMTPTSSRSQKLVNEDVVKIGKFLTISQNCYLEAKAARTPGAMTRCLVRGSFKLKRLERSTYADFVLSRFGDFPQQLFGAAVNECTGSKAVKKKPVQLEEESECSSDDDMD